MMSMKVYALPRVISIDIESLVIRFERVSETRIVLVKARRNWRNPRQVFDLGTELITLDPNLDSQKIISDRCKGFGLSHKMAERCARDFFFENEREVAV